MKPTTKHTPADDPESGSVSIDADFQRAVEALEVAVTDWSIGESKQGSGPGTDALAANWRAARRRLDAVADAILFRRLAVAHGARACEPDGLR